MGSPTIVIFCKQGHISRVIKRDEVNGPGIHKCRYCGTTEFCIQVGWDDGSGLENTVPQKPLGHEYIGGEKVYIFDVSEVKDWCYLTPDVLRVCKDCHKEFTLRSGEIDFFKGAGLNLPKRCPECRKKRKMEEKEDEKSNLLQF
ncbi:MAG: hypothetical protein GX957_06475 [Clostridiaceae bacterium]|nr:hypothetical protein [Clostridiaceae bacterium]